VHVDSLAWLFPIASGGDEKSVWQHASDYAALIGPTRARQRPQQKPATAVAMRLLTPPNVKVRGARGTNL
jgi:hypothetical protein